MASSFPKPSGDLLGAVLATVSRDTGSATVLGPVWRQVVGETLSAVSHPARWMGTTLVISCATSAWATELGRRRDEFLDRLQFRLGKKTVASLVFEAS
jgi:predicted nucleic acid-binding Zn ribbon protein